MAALPEANPKGITHVLNVSDMYVLAPGTSPNLVSEWVSWRDVGVLVLAQKWRVNLVEP